MTEPTQTELRTVIDQELTRLPVKYREPLILCYLECLTRDEAAGRLGLTQGGYYLVGTVRALATELRDEDPEAVRAATSANSARLFKLPSR